MAQQVTVQLVDDLDGTQADDISTVAFGLDGVTYEIDLTGSNADELRDRLAEFVAQARRTGGRLKRGTTVPGRGSSMSHERAQAIRAWARNNAQEISERGRVPAKVIEAFEAAQAEAPRTTRRRRSKAASAD